MKAKKASRLLLKRLELYMEHLRSLPDSVVYISATAIAQAIELGEVQVRKDLARVSHGGRKKLGHLRERLIRDIECFLDFGNVTHAVLVGAGKLGQALMNYPGFEQEGIKLLAAFDVREENTGIAGGTAIHPVSDLQTFCRDHNIHVGIITVPQEAAQEVCDQLVACGIVAIWNFAPITLRVPEHVLVLNENLAVSANALRLQMERQLDSRNAKFA